MSKVYVSDQGLQLTEGDLKFWFDEGHNAWVCSDGRTTAMGADEAWAKRRYENKKELYDLAAQVRPETHEIMVQRYWCMY